MYLSQQTKQRPVIDDAYIVARVVDMAPLHRNTRTAVFKAAAGLPELKKFTPKNIEGIFRRHGTEDQKGRLLRAFFAGTGRKIKKAGF